MSDPALPWTPPARPGWVERLNAFGDSAGGAERLVGLDAEELLDTARDATGLADFGDGDWEEPYAVFVRALREEANLHLTGRILARTELVRTLANRLELAQLWSRQPALLDADVTAPVFVVGSGRSGTSILFELLASDPANRAPAMWEMQHPLAAHRGESLGAQSDRVERFAHDLQPEYETMHANSGFLPNECLFITMHAFLSDHWGSQHVVPSYQAFLARADHRAAYRYHRRFLQTLQAGAPARRWILKAPSHLWQLPALFDVYPDARIVRTHRDPLKTLPSLLSLIGTLLWMRSDRVDLRGAARGLPAGLASLYRREIEGRESGDLPDERFVDVHYADLVRDPAKTVAALYERLGWPCDAATVGRIAAYARDKPRGAHGAHRYELADFGLDAARERDRFRFYRERFGIPEEP